MIANGDVFGAKQSVILHLLDIPPAMGILEGVCMEIDDLALPLVKGSNFFFIIKITQLSWVMSCISNT